MTDGVVGAVRRRCRVAQGPDGAMIDGMRILHLADRGIWSAVDDGWYRSSTRGADLADVGFLHASTARQVPGVVERFYADVDLADYALLVIDVDRCAAAGSPVRWDPVGDDHFPHIVGPLPVEAVVAVLDCRRDAAGRLELPDLTGLDVAVAAPE